MYGYIYKITNNINGKVYIGRTQKTIQERFNEHCAAALNLAIDSKYLLLIQKAIRKYGVDSFRLDLVFSCETFEEYETKEQEFILMYDSRNINKGYNIHIGGTGGDTVTCLPPDKYKERSDKISKALSGQHMFNDGEIEFWVKPDKIEYYRSLGFAEGKINFAPLSEEHKRKISEGLKGKSKGMSGKHHSEETKELIRKMNTGRKRSEETKQKISNSKKGTTLSEEVRQRMSEQRKGVPKSEEHRKNIGLAHKGKHKTEEHKSKISETIKGSKWVNNGEMQIQAKPFEIDDFIARGFSYGMLPKNKR